MKGVEPDESSGQSSTTDLSVTLSLRHELLGDESCRLFTDGGDFGEKTTELGLKGYGVTDWLLSSELSLSVRFRERLSLKSNSLSSFSSSYFLHFDSRIS